MFDVIKTIVAAVVDFACSLLGYGKEGVTKAVDIISMIWFR